MSRTIGSPAWMTRSDGLVVGRRRVRPGPDDREVGLLVALGDELLADLGGDVRLGPADEPPGGDPGDDPVGGLGRQAQERDLVGVLDHAQLAQHARTASSNAVPGPSAAWSRRTCIASIVSDTATRAPPTRPGRRPARTGRRSRPRSAMSHRRAQPGLGRAALEPGHDDERRVARADDEQGQPLEGHRLVAGQVAQVRADADEQGATRRHAAAASAARASRAAKRSAGTTGRVATVMRRAPAGRARRRPSRVRPRTACDRRGPCRRPRARACLRCSTSSCWPTASTCAPCGDRPFDGVERVVGRAVRSMIA